MTLLFMDGFEGYSTGLPGKWTQQVAAAQAFIPGRTGGAYVSLPSNSGTGALRKQVPAADTNATFIVGVAWMPLNTAGSTSEYVGFSSDNGVTDHITITRTTNNYLQVLRGVGGTLLATSSAPLTLNVWSYVEFKATLHDTTGSFTLRINENVVASGTNVDTKNAGTSTVFDSVKLGLVSGGASVYSNFDDFYLCNAAGTINNNFLGDVAIETVLPVGPSGSTVAAPVSLMSSFVAATASTNYGGGGSSPANTVDGNPSTWWNAYSPNVPAWLRFQFSTPVTANRYRLLIGETTQAPRIWTFEGSNDGTTWTVLDSRTNEPSRAQTTYRTYSFTNTTAYTYYRINISANGGAADFTTIYEMDLWSAPVTGGTASTWVGSDGNSIDNYLLVNEEGPPNPANYVESSTVGDNDLYVMGDITRTAGSIKGIQVNNYVAKSDAGTRGSHNLIKTGSTVTPGPDFTLTTSYQTNSSMFEKNPTTGVQFTIAEVNAVEAGIGVAL